MERAYTVTELTALRRAIDNEYLYGTYQPNFGGGRVSRSYNAVDKEKIVEERVRTHMLAGHTAEDLIMSEK